MLTHIQEALGRLHLRLTRISPASQILHWLGCWIVANPEELKQAPGFWQDNEDRQLPTPEEYFEPKVQMAQAGGEFFRRHLRKDLATYAMVLSFALSVAIFILGKAAIFIVTPKTNDGHGQVAVVSEEKISDQCKVLRDQMRAIKDHFGGYMPDMAQMPREGRDVVVKFETNCKGVSY